MKKLFMLSTLVASSVMFSQGNMVKTEETPTIEKMNILKTNVTGLLFRNFNITYERPINKWFSVTGGLNLVPKGSVPYARQFNLDESINDAKMSTTAFTLEGRFYLGKGYGKGFYLAPYYRYTNVNVSNITVNIEDQNNQNIPVNVQGKMNAHSAGLMLGTQWFLGKKKDWVLDWWIIGAHYGASRGDLQGLTNRTLNEQEQAELKKELSGLDVPLVDYSVTTNANGADVKVNGPWAGVRGGISIGYRF
ncbi:DUF3575 domain-containing protein [Riemerella anatipestifer]|nr:DUF3575 domain-containing protein [Riemerella anatipestifer]MDY3533559.1 DUF3575 domain-containing protein [Riemerella anatipestifer]MDY3535964.1 DUF3575 domain-containing protein [Riemerella anatipestifer]